MNFYLIEELVHCSWNESSKILISTKILKESILTFRVQIFRYHRLPITTEHGIGLPRTRLPVGKHSHIISLWNFTNRWYKLLKYLSLCSLLAKCIIEFCLQDGERVGCDIDGSALNVNIIYLHLPIRILLIYCLLHGKLVA